MIHQYRIHCIGVGGVLANTRDSQIAQKSFTKVHEGVAAVISVVFANRRQLPPTQTSFASGVG